MPLRLTQSQVVFYLLRTRLIKNRFLSCNTLEKPRLWIERRTLEARVTLSLGFSEFHSRVALSYED